MVYRILAALAVLALAAGTPAQKKKEEFRVPIPEKLERSNAADQQGRLQWSKFEAERCVNCKGRGTMQCLHCARFEDDEDCPECKKAERAPCRVCAGTGEMPDILVRAPCPSCLGASMTRCFICRGAGRFPVTGGGKRPAKCGSCKTVGAYPCATCKGKRFVETPKLKPSVGVAKLADLEKALTTLEKVRAAVATFESKSDGRKDMKAYSKALARGTKYFPPLKRAAKHFENASKKQSKGAVWTAYGDMVENQAKAAKQALEYYLAHQKRLLELCIARARHNADLDAKKK
jgi:hypothetical protein